MTSHLRRRRAKQFTSNETMGMNSIERGKADNSIKTSSKSEWIFHIRREVFIVYMAMYIYVIRLNRK